MPLAASGSYIAPERIFVGDAKRIEMLRQTQRGPSLNSLAVEHADDVGLTELLSRYRLLTDDKIAVLQAIAKRGRSAAPFAEAGMTERALIHAVEDVGAVQLRDTGKHRQHKAP